MRNCERQFAIALLKQATTQVLEQTRCETCKRWSRHAPLSEWGYCRNCAVSDYTSWFAPDGEIDKESAKDFGCRFWERREEG